MNIGGMGVSGSQQPEITKSTTSTGTSEAKKAVTEGLPNTQKFSLEAGKSSTQSAPLSQGGSPLTHLKTQEQGNAVKSFFTSIGQGIKQLFSKSSNRSSSADAAKTDKMTQKSNDLGVKSLRDTWSHAADIGGQGQSSTLSFHSEGNEYTCTRPPFGSGITLQLKADYDGQIRNGVHIPDNPNHPPLYNKTSISTQNPIPHDFLKAIEQFKNDHPQYG